MQEQARSATEILVDAVEERRPHIDEVLTANEVFVVGHLTATHGIITIDESRVGDGLVGTTTLALHYLIDNDAQPKENSPLHTPVPYGYMAGMHDQLV